MKRETFEREVKALIAQMLGDKVAGGYIDRHWTEYLTAEGRREWEDGHLSRESQDRTERT